MFASLLQHSTLHGNPAAVPRAGQETLPCRPADIARHRPRRRAQRNKGTIGQPSTKDRAPPFPARGPAFVDAEVNLLSFRHVRSPFDSSLRQPSPIDSNSQSEPVSPPRNGCQLRDRSAAPPPRSPVHPGRGHRRRRAPERVNEQRTRSGGVRHGPVEDLDAVPEHISVQARILNHHDRILETPVARLRERQHRVRRADLRAGPPAVTRSLATDGAFVAAGALYVSPELDLLADRFHVHPGHVALTKPRP
jgi:hypothetical protein